jgi:hypothetical protein
MLSFELDLWLPLLAEEGGLSDLTGAAGSSLRLNPLLLLTSSAEGLAIFTAEVFSLLTIKSSDC